MMSPWGGGGGGGGGRGGPDMYLYQQAAGTEWCA